VEAQNIPVTNRTLDLNYVATQIPKGDKFFFAQLDPGQFQQAVNALNAQIATATDAEFYVGLAQLVAMAADDHTALYLYLPQFQFLPLDFRWVDDGMFVVGAGSAYLNALGTQVVAVEGMPIAQVVQLLGTTIYHANDQYLHYNAAANLNFQQILQGLHIAPVAPTTAFTFQTLAGNQFTLQIAAGARGGIAMLDPPLALGPWPDYLDYGNAYTGVLSNSFFYSAPNKMVYAKYNTCEDLPGAPVSAFDSGVLAALDANPVDTLVIDLRYNGGGDEFLLFPLGVGLLQRLPKLQANPRFHVYLVIDAGTFSSGMYDAMAFVSGFLEYDEGLPPVNTSQVFTVIGQPTSGKPVGYGDVVSFTLPGSTVTGSYSTDAINQNMGVIPDAPSFNPDIPVSVRSTDWFARFDPVMAAILARSNGAPAPPSGSAVTVNGASFRIDQGIAPGSFASTFGAFGVAPDQVLVGGLTASIVGSSVSQVNFLVPATAAVGATQISVRAGGVEVASGQFTVSAAGPGIFVLDPTNPSQPGAIENQDFSVNSQGNAAAVGSVVQIFATGYSPLDSSGNAPVQVFFGDLPAQVQYSGPAPQLPGLWQINAVVPQGTPIGQSPVFIAAGNLASNGVTIWVQ